MAVMAGLAIGGAVLKHFGKKKAAKKAKKQAKKRRQEALAQRDASLAQLSPDAMRSTSQAFQNQYMAQANPSMQYDQQRLQANMARRGLTGSGLSQDLSAGIGGGYAQAGLASSWQNATNVASQRAGIIGQTPLTALTPSGPNWMEGLGSVADAAASYSANNPGWLNTLKKK
jgi:hypothetical protein